MPRSKTGIRRLASGRYQATVCIPHSRNNLKRIFATEQEAWNWRTQQMIALRQNGQHKREAAPEMSETLKEMLTWAEDRRPATRVMVASFAHRVLACDFLCQPVDRIGQQDIERFKRDLLSDGLAPITVDYYLYWMRKLFRLLIGWGKLAQSPADAVRPIKEQDIRERYLSPDEQSRLFAACSPPLLRAVKFALLTGARKAEILGLRWADIDRARGTATIGASRAKGKRVRRLYLNADCLKMVGKAAGSPLVFPGPRGNSWGGFDRVWMDAKRQAGLADFHFHDLRHTYASRLVQKGVDLYRVSKLLGHSSIRQTERYAHLSPANLATVAEGINLADVVSFAVGPEREGP